MLVNAVGVFCCALSPALVLGVLVVFPRPYRVILALSSAFAFVLTFMLSGLVWTAIPPLRGSLIAIVLYSTAFQELGRWLMYLCYVQLQHQIAEMRGISIHSLSNLTSASAVLGERFACSAAIGVGIAATHALLLTGRLLKDTMQPGSLYVDECSLSRYGLAALVALAFVALQVLWTIYAFTHAFPSNSVWPVALVVGTRARRGPERRVPMHIGSDGG
jgi:anterior pharynx defective protein 1